MFTPRGPLPARRAAAHWVVIAAAALTTLVTAAIAAALAAFAGQALPQAARHDLVTAPGTGLIASGSFSGTRVSDTSNALHAAVAAALPGVPFGFWPGVWSDPLGLVPGAQPARPAGLDGNTPVLQAASLGGITAHAVLVSGRWPGSAPPRAAGPIPAALPASTARLLRLRAGDTITVKDRSSGQALTFAVTGLFTQRPGSGSYWRLSTVPASGSATASGFTTYGPLAVAPAAFAARLAAGSGPAGTLAVATGTWVAQPDLSRVADSRLFPLAAGVSALTSAESSSAALSSVQITTGLPAVLAGTGSNLTVARSLLAISALQLVVLAAAALIAVARLLATQREGETALLAARGATRGQLVRLTAAEVVPLAAVCAGAGGAAGVWLAGVLGRTLSGVSPQGAGAWLDALAAAAAIALLAAGALLLPVLRPPGVTAAGVRRGRQAAVAGATRAGADLALIALAVLAGWQLRRYSAVSAAAGSGTPSIDPVLVLAPALALAGGTVLTLRLLPAAARAADRLAARGRGLTGALAGWQFSRQPLRQGGAALLLVMAVATGALALAQHASWSRSAADQAAFTAGGDVRVDLAAPLPAGSGATLSQVPGVQSAMAAAVVSSQASTVLAIDSAQAGPVVRLRSGEAGRPARPLFAAIGPAAATGGRPLAGRPRAVTLTATLSRTPLGRVTAVFTVIDADGAAFQLPAQAALPADGRPHVLTAPLGGTGLSGTGLSGTGLSATAPSGTAPSGTALSSTAAAYPLRLTQVTLTYTLPAKQQAAPARLTVGGATPSTWTGAASSGELDSQADSAPVSSAHADPQAAGWQAGPGGATLAFDPGFGVTYDQIGARYVPAPVQGQVTLTAASAVPVTVPALATQTFLRANKTQVGKVVFATFNGVSVPVRIVAAASAFPTVGGSALVVDLRSLQSFLAGQGGSPVAVSQWWLATAGARVPPSLARSLPPGATVTSRAALAAATLADPLSAAPQRALTAMALAAALLAIAGFWVSIAADVRQRRAEHALLAALGVTQRSAALRLFLEKLLLSVPSAALGLVLGLVVARLLVPAVTLTPAAQVPVPPPLTLFDLPQTASLAAAVAVLPALAAALVVFRRPDPATELRAAEAA